MLLAHLKFVEKVLVGNKFLKIRCGSYIGLVRAFVKAIPLDYNDFHVLLQSY